MREVKDECKTEDSKSSNVDNEENGGTFDIYKGKRESCDLLLFAVVFLVNVGCWKG